MPSATAAAIRENFRSPEFVAMAWLGLKSGKHVFLLQG